MNKLIETAFKLALEERNSGRRVCVLVPSCRWMRAAKDAFQGYDMVFVRASTIHSSLLLIRVDTLILVHPGCEEWSDKGEQRARDHLLSGSLRPEVMNVGGTF